MGLDISAYNKLILIKTGDYDMSLEGDTTVHISPGPGFQRHAAPLVKGTYSYATEIGFRAGSYSGYNLWREQLCFAAHGQLPKHFWSAGETTGIFMELINFSDCEGVIGPTVSAKLYTDFNSNRPRILQKAKGQLSYPEYSYFRDRYYEWTNAFKLAADAGAVKFH